MNDKEHIMKLALKNRMVVERESNLSINIFIDKPCKEVY